MSKIRKSARGEECSLRITNVCNYNPETTVLAHIAPGGMGAKCNDIHSVYACSACHDVIDGRGNGYVDREEVHSYILDALIETQLKLIDKGLLKIA